MRFLICVSSGIIIFGSYIAILIVVITNGKFIEALLLATIWGFIIMGGLYSLKYNAKSHFRSYNLSDRPKLNELGRTSSMVIIRTIFMFFLIIAIIITVIIMLRVIF